MWKCYDCEAIFEEPATTYQENVGDYWGAPAYETFDCCPKCKSDNIDEIDEEKEYERWESERY